jgi:uncharacterized membrane protein
MVCCLIFISYIIIIIIIIIILGKQKLFNHIAGVDDTCNINNHNNTWMKLTNVLTLMTWTKHDHVMIQIKSLPNG